MQKRWYALTVLFVSTVLLFASLIPYANNYKLDNLPIADHPPIAPPAEEPEPEKPDNLKDFAALQKENPEIVGWIIVPGTPIDYPIMQSGEDTAEDFYLNHTPEGKSAKSGSIYIQRFNEADFTDPNTIIYGHNMANGSMFRAIHQFRQRSFFKNHDTVYVSIPGHTLVYRIYSVFIHNTQHLLALYGGEEGYADYLAETLNPSHEVQQVREGITPTTADRVITLSTCTNKSDGDNRLLLVAVLENDIETK